MVGGIMMIVSDYDDTFYINEEDVKKNVSLVHEFMKDNIFVIATGRSYFDFKRVEERYNIKYNYLVINHGATILKNDEIIYNIFINEELKKCLIKDLYLDIACSVFACSIKESRVDIECEILTKIHVRYESVEKAKEIYNFLMKKYKDDINIFYAYEDKALEIVSKDVDKVMATEYIRNLENIPYDKVYTIGNGQNDIEMVKHYNGYAIKGSYLDINNLTNNICDNVSNLFLKVIKKDKF